jgi:hypothetical protein
VLESASSLLLSYGITDKPEYQRERFVKQPNNLSLERRGIKSKIIKLLYQPLWPKGHLPKPPPHFCQVEKWGTPGWGEK